MRNGLTIALITALLLVGGPNLVEAGKRAVSHVKITGSNEQREVDVEQVAGKNRLLTSSTITSIQVPNGQDPLPDTFFRINAAGLAGDTITVSVQATNYDPTNPLQNFPAYSYVYTLQAADVGDERQLAINLADALNADPLFEAQSLEAEAIADDKRPYIHVSSTEFSLNGEDYERPNVGDFDVTTTGTTTIFLDDDYKNIISRAKPVSLGRDPNNPHKLGVQAIAGTVFLRSSDPDSLIRERIGQVGNQALIDLNVNGSGTPVVFEFSANPDGGRDRIIDSLKFYGNDGNIKTQVGNFLGLNSALANCILIEFIRESVVIFSEELCNTVDLLALWSTGAGQNKIISQSGGDYFESTFSLVDKNLAFVLENGEDSKIRVTVRDNLTQIGAFYLLIDGSED